MSVLVLALLPWMALGLYAALAIRLPPGLPAGGRDGSGRPLPLVSIVVPARNEEAGIGRCVASLTRQDYPSFEVIVVDDQSTDGTAEIVRRLPRENADEVLLVQGEPLPEGWLGKPWACAQGAARARGDLLLFTDADTVHAPGLLGQAVSALGEEGGDALTLVGRQEMETFWEQLVQPQFFMLLAFRFPRAGEPRRPERWRHAISNGQYLLFRRDVYTGVGGHEAVRGEVVEDMRLAQELTRGGWRLLVRGADGLRTRMYRSLGHLVEGWSKNVATGVLQTTAGWLLPFMLPLSLLVGTTLWLLPPAALAWAVLSGTGGPLLLWSAVATLFGVAFWGIASAVMRGNPLYGLLYPLGSLMAGYIFVRSWVMGSRVRWKGRSYQVSAVPRREAAVR